MTHRLQVTFDDGLFEALQAEAARSGASLAEVVRRSVAQKLNLLSTDDRLDILDRTAGAWGSEKRPGVAFQREQRRGLDARGDTLDTRRRSPRSKVS